MAAALAAVWLLLYVVTSLPATVLHEKAQQFTEVALDPVAGRVSRASHCMVHLHLASSVGVHSAHLGLGDLEPLSPSLVSCVIVSVRCRADGPVTGAASYPRSASTHGR